MIDNEKKDPFDGLTESTDDKGIFRKFKSTGVAAVDWINDLIKNGYRSADRKSRRSSLEEGLFMSDEMQEVGVLSIAPALSALLMELSLLLNPDENPKVSFTDMLTENKSAVLKVITESVCRLISECFPSGIVGDARRVLLSSMPFYDDTTLTDGAGWDAGGYLDTASWVSLVADLIESFLNRLETVAPELYRNLKWELKSDRGVSQTVQTLTTDKVKEAVRTIYLSSIRVTCDCIVRSKDTGKVLGWSFRKMDGSAEPSLYFSYVASTVYLGLYKRFNRSGMIDKLRRYEKQLSESEECSKFKFYDGIADGEKRAKTIEVLTRKGFDKFADYLGNLEDEDITEMDLLYNKINNGQPLTYKIDEWKDGCFTLLKESTVQFAETLWKEGYGSGKNKVPFRVNMSKGPCFEDGTLVDMDVVRLSSHNNAFFNNLFVIGIILNSAYDAEVEREDPEEYDKMLNAFQLSIQNTQRCYNEIANEKLLYKIDSYILDFSDKTDAANEELAKQMRKVNMAVVPLMPLILKNNNLMSQYVVKYPQKQMTESLKDIIKNKKRKGTETSWVWDKDGYNAITNYYYVDALISFYRYYEVYEEPFIGDEEATRLSETRAVRAERERLNVIYRNRVNELNAAIKERDEYIAEVRAISKGIARLVVNGLIDLVDEQLTSDKLIGALSEEERYNRDNVIEELNSFDKDSDIVKISKLVHLGEKLRLLSLLSMENNSQINAFLKNGSPADQKDAHSTIIKNVFGERGNPSKFMENLIAFLASSKQGGDPNKQ